MKRSLLLWVASLVLVALSTFAFAQAQFPPGSTRLPQPQMLSGNDIGFRVEGTDVNGRPIGTLVLRLNGNWVEVGPSAGFRPATK